MEKERGDGEARGREKKKRGRVWEGRKRGWGVGNGEGNVDGGEIKRRGGGGKWEVGRRKGKGKEFLLFRGQENGGTVEI